MHATNATPPSTAADSTSVVISVGATLNKSDASARPITMETPLPKEVAGKPAQVRLVDGVLVMTPLKL